MAKTPVPKTPKAALEKYIKDFNLSTSKLALELGQNTVTFKKILDGSKRISVELALLLAKKFSTTADFWIDLQKKAALAEAKVNTDLQQRLKGIKKAVVVPDGDAAAKKPGRKPGVKPASEAVAVKKPGRKPGRKPASQSVETVFSSDSDSDL